MTQTAQTTRRITHRTRGSQHGFIRRMVSPGDLGESMKPFIFLDFVHGHVEPGAGFGWHPHSGIATLTYSLNADAAYEDTAGQKGRVEATGLEWMRAGGGTWHQGFIHPREETVTSFQLWVALPPGVEDGPPEGVYVPPGQVPQVGNVRVLLGEYGAQRNPITTPSSINYLDVALGAGETWTYSPPAGHDVAWAFVYRGRARVAGESITGELVVFEDGPGDVTLEAAEASRVLFGSAAKHAHRLVLGTYSVHTNRESLARGEARIREVRDELRRAGRV
jgi:redox-sensitive bicupin YhaK (pirin superfamily)